MANSWSALAPTNFMPKVQRFRDRFLVSKAIAFTKFAALLKNGQKIDWPFVTDLRSQTYTPGTDLTIDNNTATSDTLTINQSEAVTFTRDPNSDAQALDKTVVAKLAKRSGHILGRKVDQSVLQKGIDDAGETYAGGTMTASGIYSALTDIVAVLQRNDADRPLFAVLDPERIALLAQNEVANGFNLADSALKNGFVGKSQAGLTIFNSNNLPTSCTLSMATQPTAGDTVTIYGVTWTWVADGTAANPGELNVGGNAADAQAILRSAVNGSTPPSAGDYVDVSVRNRRKYQNGQVSMAAFSGNNAVITAYGKQGNSETFTAAGNVFGTETGNLLAGEMGAIALAMQIMPTMYIGKEAKRPEHNYIMHQLHGEEVFTEDVDGLVDITINV